MALHIMKLVVGLDTLTDFAEWQKTERVEYQGREANLVRTRYKPKQADEILESGGSIYRIIKGKICCRQKIIGFENVQTDDGQKCLFLTDTDIIRTVPTPKRAFQGWRYLKEDAVPADIGLYTGDEELSDMELELRELGLIK